MFFSSDSRTGTTQSPSIPNIADNYKGPNVSQYGWTSYETQQVNQLVQYVDLAREYAEQAATAAQFVADSVDYVNGVVLDIQTLANTVNQISVEIHTWHDAVKAMHDNVVTLHTNVVRFATEATTSASLAKVSETGARGYASQAQSMAQSAENSKLAARASATQAAVSEVGSKDWYDKSYDLYVDLKKGQVYRGKWDPQSGRYPDNEGTNSVWDVVVEGKDPPIFEWDNKTWTTGQRLIYTLTDNMYSQVDTVLGVSSVNGKTGAVLLVPKDLGLLTVDEMDERYVNSKPVQKGTTDNAYSVMHLMPLPSSSDTYPRSFLTGTVEVHRSDLSGGIPIFDRMEIAASSMGNGFTGSIFDDSGNYKLVTYEYKGQRWLGLANKVLYPSCNIYFRGEARKNPSFRDIQFTIADYIVESTTGGSPVYPNPDIRGSIADYAPAKKFYADNYKVYTEKDKPTANEINALDKSMGGQVNGIVSFTKSIEVGVNPDNPTKPTIHLETIASVGSIQIGGLEHSKGEISGHGRQPLDQLNIITKTDDGFTINNRPLSAYIPVVDKVTLGLDKVNNWGATNAVDDPSETKYSTARAVHDVNQKVEDIKTLAFVYSLIM